MPPATGDAPVPAAAARTSTVEPIAASVEPAPQPTPEPPPPVEPATPLPVKSTTEPGAATTPVAQTDSQDSTQRDPDSRAPKSSGSKATDSAGGPSAPVAPPSKGLYVGLAAATLIGVGCLWAVLRPAPQGADSTASMQTIASATAPTVPAPPRPAEAPSPSSTHEAAPAPPAASSVAGPEASATSSVGQSPDSAGLIVVTVDARPRTAKFYYRGKEVSGVPLRVELAPGQKRAFEVGLPGYITRKLIVDGTKSEMFVGLNPVKPATPAAGQPRVPRAAY